MNKPVFDVSFRSLFKGYFDSIVKALNPLSLDNPGKKAHQPQVHPRLINQDFLAAVKREDFIDLLLDTLSC